MMSTFPLAAPAQSRFLPAKFLNIFHVINVMDVFIFGITWLVLFCFVFNVTGTTGTRSASGGGKTYNSLDGLDYNWTQINAGRLPGIVAGGLLFGLMEGIGLRPLHLIWAAALILVFFVGFADRVEKMTAFKGSPRVRLYAHASFVALLSLAMAGAHYFQSRSQSAFFFASGGAALGVLLAFANWWRYLQHRQEGGSMLRSNFGVSGGSGGLSGLKELFGLLVIGTLVAIPVASVQVLGASYRIGVVVSLLSFTAVYWLVLGLLGR